ncbi:MULTISPECIES: hypothetical protein [Pseudomonas]|uniref:hypothetical protein n=1 Tax=Pseudomonas TaxID=286 RepID=UPI0011DD32E0|nr:MULTISPECIES: hypothetical protein [Pseudomonas]
MSGYGDYISLSNDPDLGVGVYRINLDGCVLKLFEKGLVIKFYEKSMRMFYSDISKITSHLSAAVFSKASAAKNVSISIPLEIHFSEEVVVFDVQLLVCSRVLIVLNELWRGSNN